MSRLREGRANTARGAAHFLRETLGRVRYRRGQGTAHGAGGQRLLRPTLALPSCRRNGCPLLYHHPPARQLAGPASRLDTRGQPRHLHSLLDGRRRRCRRDVLRLRSRRLAGLALATVRLIIRRVTTRSTRFPARLHLRQIQLSRLHHQTADGEPTGHWRKIITGYISRSRHGHTRPSCSTPP